jgi:aspartate racemase
VPGDPRPLRQPTIGILGGTSHVVATRYYDLINARMNRVLGGDDIAETILLGMNYGNVAAFARSGRWEEFQSYVAEKVDRLIDAGADLVIGTSNTTHEVMGPVMEERDVAFIPITEPLAAAITASGVRRVGIFGTMTTMQEGRVMREVREATGAEIIAPRADERGDIDRVIFEELVKFQFRPEARERYRQIALRMKREEGIEGIVLGCTEIYLLIDQPHLPELEVFATARLHAHAAADWAAART